MKTVKFSVNFILLKMTVLIFCSFFFFGLFVLLIVIYLYGVCSVRVGRFSLFWTHAQKCVRIVYTYLHFKSVCPNRNNFMMIGQKACAHKSKFTENDRIKWNEMCACLSYVYIFFSCSVFCPHAHTLTHRTW